MKTKWFIIAALCAVLLTACSPDKEEMAEAWTACESATGDPSGIKVSGKVYEIDSIDGAEPSFNIDDDSEETPSYGQKYTDDESYAFHNFTKDLNKATSVLCIKVKTKIKRFCYYPKDGFTLKYFSMEAQLTLLAWPSGELIAQTTLGDLVGSEVSCPIQILYKSGETACSLYDRIDMDGWLEQYVIPGE